MQPGKTIGASATPFDYSEARREWHHDYLLPAIFRSLTALPAGAKILDMGCGSGYLCGQLIGRGFDVSGVDASESGIRIARESFPQARFEIVSVTDPDLPDRIESTFDAIVSMEVIEHLYSPALFLKNCRQLLGNGGLLIISTPYHGYLKYLLLAATGKMDAHLEPDFEGGHIKFWSRSTLARILQSHGFAAKGFDGCGRMPFLWKSMVVNSVRLPD